MLNANNRKSGSNKIGIRLAEQLARLVDAGVVESGDVLPTERDLAAIFGVSRQTIRLALSELERNLYLTRLAGREARINIAPRFHARSRSMVLNGLPPCSPAELLEVRMALDVEIALCAMTKSNPVIADELASLCDRLHADSFGALGQWLIDLSFQLRLVAAARNPLLMSMAQDLYFLTAPTLGGVPRVLPHKHLVDALVAGRAEAVARFVRESLVCARSTEEMSTTPMAEAVGSAEQEASEGRDAGGATDADLPDALRLFWPAGSRQ